VLTGIVNQRGWPIVRVIVCHPQAPYRQNLEVMVDTGCEVELVLSRLDIAALGLPFSYTRSIQLADGTSCLVNLYNGVVEWFGTLRPVQVYESTGGMPLLGARLLAPRKLIVDYGQGTVEIL
jgi:clan AA aspartic protease